MAVSVCMHYGGGSYSSEILKYWSVIRSEEKCFVKFDPNSYSYRNPLLIPPKSEVLNLVMIMPMSTMHIHPGIPSLRVSSAPFIIWLEWSNTSSSFLTAALTGGNACRKHKIYPVDWRLTLTWYFIKSDHIDSS